MEEFLVVGMIGTIGLIVVLSIIYSIKREKKRTEAWIRTAEDLGLEFLGEDASMMSRCGSFKFFSSGHSKKIRNVIRGEAGGIEIYIMDYKYTTGGGKNSHTHRQTICYLNNPALNLPHCYFRPELAFFDFLGKMFGGKDINFDDDPAFSQAYVLQGENEIAIREMFSPQVREYFTSKRSTKLNFEAEGGAIMFHTGKRVETEKAKDLMSEALDIMGLLS
jgi:hypothetical protein